LPRFGNNDSLTDRLAATVVSMFMAIWAKRFHPSL
jgi:hypothetical protein